MTANLNALYKLSIIVPIYNAAPYLHRCIDSILSQSFADYELLLIDDGSTDESSAICDEYAVKDARIRVFHKENGGVSSARNLGLDNAQGEWIYFADADDELVEDTLDSLISHINQDTDCVIGSFARYDSSGDEVYNTLVGQNKILTIPEAIISHYGVSPILPGNWGWVGIRILRNKIIQHYHLRFDTNIKCNEDELFFVSYFCVATKRVYYIDKIIYKYCESESSLLQSVSEKYNPDFLTCFEAAHLKYLAIIYSQYSAEKDLVQIAKNGLIQRYKTGVHYLRKFHISDPNRIKQMRSICIQSCGLHYFYTYIRKDYCRRFWKYMRKIMNYG